MVVCWLYLYVYLFTGVKTAVYVHEWPYSRAADPRSLDQAGLRTSRHHYQHHGMYSQVERWCPGKLDSSFPYMKNCVSISDYFPFITRPVSFFIMLLKPWNVISHVFDCNILNLIMSGLQFSLKLDVLMPRLDLWVINTGLLSQEWCLKMYFLHFIVQSAI